MLKLDFSLATAQERADYINKNIDPSSYFTQKELETISNYLLYGKDDDGTSCVDKKLVQIKPKHSSYARKEAESLDALLEKPTFDERSFQTGPTRYKTPKPKIDRTLDADVPGLPELWEVIDDVQHRIEVGEGKVQDPSIKKPTSSEIYELKHYLIELRRQQFCLRDSVKPTICRTKTNIKPVYNEPSDNIIWDSPDSDGLFSIAPLGLYSFYPQRFDDPRALEEIDYQFNEKAKFILDFRNPLHIYEIFENYEELRKQDLQDSNSTTGAILDTLDFYRERANLSEEQSTILDLKILHTPNQAITEEVRKRFGSTHSANYISTIYKQKICGKIADAAILHYDYYKNREIGSAWKKCICCGEFKLKDTREYVRRSRSSDGLSSTCKVCEKKKRGEKK
jgi:hypothetical protein